MSASVRSEDAPWNFSEKAKSFIFLGRNRKKKNRSRTPQREIFYYPQRYINYDIKIKIKKFLQ